MEHTSSSLALGIVGWPLTHTYSPALHQFFMETLGLEGSYTAFPCEANAVEATLSQCRAQGITGLNVTIPHKATALTLADNATPMAQLAQAANTLTLHTNGTITAHNTDIAGILASIPPTVRQHLPHTHVVVLGAGGVAKAIVAALQYYPLPQLTVVSRSQERAADVMALTQLAAHQHNTAVGWQPWPEKTTPFYAAAKTTRLLVINATPIGMATSDDTGPLNTVLDCALGTVASPGQCTAIDTVYQANTLTGFCKLAHAKGIPQQDGLAMLVHQGAESFTCWTGTSINTEIRLAALAHLRQTAT